MIDYDITDRYGAVMLLKVLIQSMEKDMNEPKNAIIKGSYEILIDLFKEDLAVTQAEIYKNFIGTIQNLARVNDDNDDIEEENEDD